MARPSLIDDVVCLGCGCLCDDLRVRLAENGAEAVGLDCELGSAWLAGLRATGCEHLVEGRPAAPEAAFEHAAQLLLRAKSPLVCGLKGAASDAQRVAVGIADRLGGCVDWTTCRADAAPLLAFQTHGAQSASLGEIAQRADLVICWQCDPATTHPRHFERYSLDPASPWLPGGRKDRTVVAIGPADSATATTADQVLQAEPDQCLAALQVLRCCLRDKSIDGDTAAQTGVALAKWQALAARIRQSNYVTIFYGAALKQQGPTALGELTLLAHELQSLTRLVTCCLGAGDNAHGAEDVLAWQTGYPMAVSFARGWPEYGPQEFTTEKLLERGEADAALVVSAAGLAGLGANAFAALRGLPSVVLSESDAHELEPDVDFRVAPLGAAPGGSVYRCDGLTLPLVDSFSKAPSHAAVLAPIMARFAALARSEPLGR